MESPQYIHSEQAVCNKTDHAEDETRHGFKKQCGRTFQFRPWPFRALQQHGGAPKVALEFLLGDAAHLRNLPWRSSHDALVEGCLVFIGKSLQ